MCAGCVMAAAAGASGVRSWFQAQTFSWLTPKRLRNGTIAVFVVAFGFSSLTLSGTTPAQHHVATAAVSHSGHS